MQISMGKYSFRNLLIDAAELAGLVQKECLGNDVIESKNKYGGKDASAIVTLADLRSEEALRDFFRVHMPDYNVIGEEFGGSYNGNGKLIIIDPLDCTKSYKSRLPNFGPIIGVYKDGKNIAGIEYNVLKNIKYVATEETGFERIGPEDDVAQSAIYIENGTEDDTLTKKLVYLVRREFPNSPLVVNSQNVLNKARVFDGKWKAFFHTGLARHDIAAVPIFARITDMKATNLVGVQYENLDPEAEIERYRTEKKEVIYANPIIIAAQEHYERFFDIFSQNYGIKW